MSFRKYVSPYALELGDLESGDCFVEGQRSCTKIEETSSGIRCTFEREGKTRSVLCLQGVLDSGWVEKRGPVLCEGETSYHRSVRERLEAGEIEFDPEKHPADLDPCHQTGKAEKNLPSGLVGAELFAERARTCGVGEEVIRRWQEQAEVLAEGQQQAEKDRAHQPKRGRPPGSKNKPRGER